MAPEDPVVTRLDHLEERVDALEKLSAAPEPLDEAETFWALRGLQQRTTPPGAVLYTGTVTLPTGGEVEWQQAFELDALLDADWTLAADVLGALGHPVRMRLLREVLVGTTTATALGALEGLGTSGQLYHHLRQLTAAGWLRSAGRGRYEVPAQRVVPLLVVLAGGLR